MNYQHSHGYFLVNHDYYLLKIINPQKQAFCFLAREIQNQSFI